MKNLLLSVIAIIAFAITSNAQCDAQSTPIHTSCGSFCASVRVQLTGWVEADLKNAIETNNTFRRQLTAAEAAQVTEWMEEQC
jgi:hypothetical protein